MVRAEIESTTSLTLHLLDREMRSVASNPISSSDTKPFQLESLSNIRHLRIEYFDTKGQLHDSNKLSGLNNNEHISPQWFVRLMARVAPLNKIKRELVIDGQPVGQLIITPDPSYEIEEIWDDTKDLMVLVFVFFIAVNALVYGAIDRAFKPVSRILQALTDLERGKLGTRLPNFELPELSSIAAKFNHMATTLEDSIKRNLGLSRQIINLEETERKSLARDLHDEIGQSITAIHVDAQAILNYKDINASTIGGLRLSAEAIVSVSEKMMGITHQILEKLRPDAIDKLGLKVALQDLAFNWQSKLENVECTVDFSGDLDGLPDDVSITVYRVLQESLTNIARYAKAGKVSIGILHEDNSLVLMVEDDGQGFDITQASSGFGLTGMRERIEGLGGDFELDSGEGQGTRMVARLPLLEAH